jgi:hypothetical protein
MPTNTIVTGPVTGGRHGWPFSLPLTDLGSMGYVAEEFFLDGTAAAYENRTGMTSLEVFHAPWARSNRRWSGSL